MVRYIILGFAVFVVGVLGLVLVFNPSEPTRIYVALIQVTGTGLAALAAYLLWRMRHKAEREKEAEQREDRQRRMLVALRSELALNIESYVGQFDPTFTSPRLQAATETMHNAKRAEHSMPMAVTVTENTVFDSLTDEIADLPDRTIGPVIRYYYYDRNVIESLNAFSSGQFERLSPARREAALAAFYDLGTETLAAAFVAYDEINATLVDDPVQFGFDEKEMRDRLENWLKDDPQIVLNPQKRGENSNDDNRT